MIPFFAPDKFVERLNFGNLDEYSFRKEHYVGGTTCYDEVLELSTGMSVLERSIFFTSKVKGDVVRVDSRFFAHRTWLFEILSVNFLQDLRLSDEKSSNFIREGKSEEFMLNLSLYETSHFPKGFRFYRSRDIHKHTLRNSDLFYLPDEYLAMGGLEFDYHSEI